MKDKQLRERVSRIEDRLFGYDKKNTYYLWLEESSRVPGILDEYRDTQNKFDLLLKHLGLEYFKKEIKETNGEVKQSVEEGFRKIKKTK